VNEEGSSGVHSLVGGWRLRTWVSIADDGSEVRPIGDAPDGLLVYSAGGTMVAVMGPRDRPRLATDDVTGGTADEQARAFATFIAYGGSYEIDGDSVNVHVEMSLFPNWIGTTQRRRWELDDSGRHLTLTSPPLVLGGAKRIQRLRWERVDVEAPAAGT
jgi:Lipocalin-like domain